MTSPLLNQRRVLVVAAAALLVGSFMRARAEAWLTEPPRHLLDQLLAPIRHPVHYVVSSVAPSRPEHSRTLEQLRAERDELERLFYQSQSEARDKQREIDALTMTRRTLPDNGPGIELIEAGVTAWSNEMGYPTLRLNRGRSDGVAPGMVVVRGQNLVGRVSDVAQLTCVVALFNAPGTHLAASIVPPAGTVEPERQVLVDLVAGGDGRTLETRTDLRQAVKAGDVAYLDPIDHAWPSEARGFILGHVTLAGPDAISPLLHQGVIVGVEPGVAMRTLNEVTIIRPRNPRNSDPRNNDTGNGVGPQQEAP